MDDMKENLAILCAPDVTTTYLHHNYHQYLSPRRVMYIAKHKPANQKRKRQTHFPRLKSVKLCLRILEDWGQMKIKWCLKAEILKAKCLAELCADLLQAWLKVKTFKAFEFSEE